MQKSAKNPKKRNIILPTLLILMGCAVFLFAAWSAMNSPVLASILNKASGAQEQVVQRSSFAQVNIAKPGSMAPIAVQPDMQLVAPTATAVPVVVDAQPITIDIPPTIQPTLEAVILPKATEVPAVAQVVEQSAAVDTSSQPGAVSAEIVVDTPTPEYVAPTAVAAYFPAAGNGGEHWIDVNLSEQRVYAYEGDTVVNSFLVSTGTWQTPTVTGNFKIWIKVRSQAMSGPGYYLPDVPYVMYFYKDYGLHGTYWHNNFGTPMSHGCVNLTIPDSEWLYNFASVGTVVNVHY
jgi:lipoprotein-anchoring transpeptidase ErfK/SrfK